ERQRMARDRLLARAQAVAGLVDRELRDGADLAGLELADGLLLFAVEEEELADPLVLAAGRVPRMALRADRARQHPQVREPADVRIRGGLEDPRDERPAWIGGDADRIIRLRLVSGHGRLVSRGGQVAHERVEQAAQPDALRRAPDEHRSEDRLLHALAEACLELGVRDLLALEVLREHIV